LAPSTCIYNPELAFLILKHAPLLNETEFDPDEESEFPLFFKVTFSRKGESYVVFFPA
jgi:hypothetical protein